MITACDISDAFLERTENDGRIIVYLDQNSPYYDTAREMVRAAEGYVGMWDWSYTAVRDALLSIDDSEQPPSTDDMSERADSLVSVYSYDLVRWLAYDPVNHLSICDEACEEFGESDLGLEKRIALGQYQAYYYALLAIIDKWPSDNHENDGFEE